MKTSARRYSWSIEARCESCSFISDASSGWWRNQEKNTEQTEITEQTERLSESRFRLFRYFRLFCVLFFFIVTLFDFVVAHKTRSAMFGRFAQGFRAFDDVKLWRP